MGSRKPIKQDLITIKVRRIITAINFCCFSLRHSFSQAGISSGQNIGAVVERTIECKSENLQRLIIWLHDNCIY